MKTMKEQLAELRAVAERFALGDAEARKLRGLIVDIIDVLLGKEPNHVDVNNSGARYLPNDPGVAGAARAIAPVPMGALAAPAGIEQPRDLVAIGTVRMGPRGPWAWNGTTWEPTEPAAAAAAPADPAGPAAMADLERELREQDAKTNTNGSKPTPTTQPGG